MTLPPSVLDALQPWADLYGNTQPISVGVTFLHLAGMMLAGGTALGADWQALRARDLHARDVALERMRGSHATVIPALAIVVLSGMAMAAADIETFAASTIYFWKLGLFALLLVNGVLLVGAERAARARDTAWARLRLSAAASVVLWLGVVLLGTLLQVSA
jgi:hypothetical protein